MINDAEIRKEVIVMLTNIGVEIKEATIQKIISIIKNIKV